MESNRVISLYEGEQKLHLDLRKNSQSRVLKAYGFREEEINSAREATAFRNLPVGAAFIVKKQLSSYVAVKLSDANPGGSNNAVVIGGIFPISKGFHDFTIGTLLCGFSAFATVYPIAGKRFDKRERRALINA